MLKRITYIFLFCVIVFSGLMINCDEPAEFELGIPFSLTYQEMKSNTAENISIKFDAVISDSRCPVDVVCVWEGNAEVQFTFSKSGSSETFSLNTSLAPKEIVLMGYNIKMAGLRPAEIISTNPPAPEDYIATMIITKADPGVCRDNSQCGEGLYCAKEIGDCDGTGQCTEKPDACITAIWNPVCGCDGRTYGNTCSAEAMGVNIAYTGECRDTGCDDGSPLICATFAPVECGDYEVLAIQNGCWICVNPQTCLPWGEAQCKEDSDCESGYCDFCGTSSCPFCDDCVPACVVK